MGVLNTLKTFIAFLCVLGWERGTESIVNVCVGGGDGGRGTESIVKIGNMHTVTGRGVFGTTPQCILTVFLFLALISAEKSEALTNVNICIPCLPTLDK